MRIGGCCLTKLWISFWVATFLFTGSMTIDAKENNWGVTRINANRINYTWTIENYSLNNLKTGERLYSPIFSGDQSNKYQWQIQLYPKGNKEDAKDWVSSYLVLKSGSNVTAYLNFHVIDGNGKKVISHVSLEPDFYANDGSNWGWPKFISHSNLNYNTKNWLPNDSLTILVEIVVREDITNISGYCRFSNNLPASEIMVMFLENDFLSDVELRVNGETIKAHRTILAAQSSWFLKEFTKYPNLDAMYLENTTVVAARQALRFMYTGKVDITEDTAEELLSLSSQLDIPQLKILCEEVLCKSMTSTNAIDILMLAELHGAENLVREASNYIAAHATSVADSSSFEKLEKSYPNPFYGILRTLINKKKN